MSNCTLHKLEICQPHPHLLPSWPSCTAAFPSSAYCSCTQSLEVWTHWITCDDGAPSATHALFMCVYVCVCCSEYWCSVEYTGAMQRGPDDVCGSEPRGALDWRELAFTRNDAAALSLSLSLRVSHSPLLSFLLWNCVCFSKTKCNLFFLSW